MTSERHSRNICSMDDVNGTSTGHNDNIEEGHLHRLKGVTPGVGVGGKAGIKPCKGWRKAFSREQA